MKTEEVLADLTALQQALAGHVGWLQRWYQAVLHHGQIPDPDSGACPIAQWHGRAAHGPMGECGAFAAVEHEHDFVHAMASQITERAAAGHKVTTSDFEALMSSSLAFGTAAQELEREVWKNLATLDPLTGLSNRQLMMTQLVRERDRAIRQKDPLCVALVDIDHFKSINDRFGHQFGDDVLRAVAGALNGTVRPYDIVYRFGGEEFLLCLPGTSMDNAVQALERVRHAIANLVLSPANGEKLTVTATFGVAALGAEISVEDCIKFADRALYQGKAAGRDRVVAYSGE